MKKWIAHFHRLFIFAIYLSLFRHTHVNKPVLRITHTLHLRSENIGNGIIFLKHNQQNKTVFHESFSSLIYVPGRLRTWSYTCLCLPIRFCRQVCYVKLSIKRLSLKYQFLKSDQKFLQSFNISFINNNKNKNPIYYLRNRPMFTYIFHFWVVSSHAGRTSHLAICHCIAYLTHLLRYSSSIINNIPCAIAN